MNTLTDREKWDIQKIQNDKNHYPSLPELRKTAAVSLAAVSACGHNMEYVPESVINREICRAAIQSKDVDCTVLPYIPFLDVQREGIQKFSADTPAFVLFSFADIRDATMAKEAVKADAYCLQLVPDKLLTEELCKIARQSPNADKKVMNFIDRRFPSIAKSGVETIPKSEKTQHKSNKGLGL
jgi:hypothetical protein